MNMFELHAVLTEVILLKLHPMYYFDPFVGAMLHLVVVLRLKLKKAFYLHAVQVEALLLELTKDVDLLNYL